MEYFFIYKNNAWRPRRGNIMLGEASIAFEDFDEKTMEQIDNKNQLMVITKEQYDQARRAGGHALGKAMNGVERRVKTAIGAISKKGLAFSGESEETVE